MMETDYENLIVSLEESICLISIDREKKLNALNKATLNELHQAVTSALRDESILSIIITGKGSKAFVAGADISEFSNYNAEEGKELAAEGQTKVFDVIHHAGKPIIAVINGFALGGGFELALACHMRIASTSAKFGFPEVSLGLIPGYGGTQRLTQIVGRGLAFELILTGEMITAERASALGLVNHITSPEEAIDKAKEILKTIGTRSPQALAAAIRAVNASQQASGYEVEIDEFSKRFGTEEFREGVAAFMEKRKPNFKKKS